MGRDWVNGGKMDWMYGWMNGGMEVKYMDELDVSCMVGWMSGWTDGLMDG